jgi:hypothetical protein
MRPEHARALPKRAELTASVWALDWRLLTLACLPLAVLTYHGRGYNESAVAIGAGAPLLIELASTFFIILVALAAFGFVLRYGPRWFVPVLAVQSLLLAAAGERTPVIMDAVALIVLLCHARHGPSARQGRVAAALTLAAILAITGVRAEQGRTLYTTDTGLSARVSALGTGLSGLGSSHPGEDNPGLLAQAAVRLDGVDFAGGILQAENMGAPRLSAMAVPESLLLSVPSAAWPSKLAHAAGLNPVVAETDAFGLQQAGINFLPGMAGLYAGFLAWPSLIVLLAALGFLWGIGERWLMKAVTPVRLVLLAGAVIAALTYEAGLPGMLLGLRPAIAIALILKLAEFMRARRNVASREGVRRSGGGSAAAAQDDDAGTADAPVAASTSRRGPAAARAVRSRRLTGRGLLSR